MSNEVRPATLTIESATAFGLTAEIVKNTACAGSRFRIEAKRPGEIIRFLAACGMDCTVEHEGPTTKSWGVRDQDGHYHGAVLTAQCVPNYALFTMAS